MKQYEYRKLRGRIVEICGSSKAFSEKIGLSEVTLSNKLNGKSGFSQGDIETWAKALDIDPSEYGVYFFA